MKLSPTDAAFIYMETASTPQHLANVCVVDGHFTAEDMRLRLEQRAHLLPAFRRKLLFVPFNLDHPRWVDDPDFDYANHIREHRLPEGSSLQDALDFASELNEPLLDRARPLWRIEVIHGLKDVTILLHSAHHCLLDGASAVEIAMTLFDFSAEPEDIPDAQVLEVEDAPSAAQLLSESMAAYYKVWSEPPQLPDADTQAELTKASQIMSEFVSKPAITPSFNMTPVGPKRKLRFAEFEFSDIRKLRELGGTVNDIALAIVTEAVARYLKSIGEQVDGQHFRLMCPVNVRTEDEKGSLGNRISAVYPYLPASPMGALKRLDTVIAEMLNQKDKGNAQALALVGEMMGGLSPVAFAASQLVGTQFDWSSFAAANPSPVQQPVTGFQQPNFGINFVCTNVPGVQVPQFVEGCEIRQQVPLMVLSGNLGLAVTITTYNQSLYIGYNYDPRIVANGESLVEHTYEIAGELREALKEDEMVGI
ncbi:MAG: hypothetical protein CMQ43_00005 [Gammaproteobacteria bacterium]|jgi:diacylglycerol O-acyltransferase / wax synthase|nr:hypothetical protein [Porticoccaceae bacterium]MBK79285.1 hypothetical protein [Gammaproteobacteria bacterium]HAF68424.1 hypothetical protein [Acidimicrobiaceae bacterium]|tara:strand:- start:373 stop:1806 length:1434 start_codon:yes stop_codon:yes gene_type:complete